jgi:hypothetical protein
MKSRTQDRRAGVALRAHLSRSAPEPVSAPQIRSHRCASAERKKPHRPTAAGQIKLMSQVEKDYEAFLKALKRGLL